MTVPDFDNKPVQSLPPPPPPPLPHPHQVVIQTLCLTIIPVTNSSDKPPPPTLTHHHHHQAVIQSLIDHSVSSTVTTIQFAHALNSVGDDGLYALSTHTMALMEILAAMLLLMACCWICRAARRSAVSYFISEANRSCNTSLQH